MKSTTVSTCPICGVRYPHHDPSCTVTDRAYSIAPSYRVDSVKGGRIVEDLRFCHGCTRWIDKSLGHHYCTGVSRLALLEAVAKAAKAWDASGRWQDYRALHEAIKALEDA